MQSKNESSYNYKVYNKIGTTLNEIFDFDFSNIHVKGEFEQTEYIYLAYVREYFIEGYSVSDFILKLCKLISPYTKIRIVYSPIENKDEIINLLKNENLNIEKFEFIKSNISNPWLRDSLPTFVKDKKTGETIAIKTFFNNYDTEQEILENENIAVLELIKQLPEVSKVVVSNYTQDGGARIFNGNGTMMLCEHYERKKNIDFDKKKSEDLFRKFFGVENFIWVPHASVFDDSDFFGKIYFDKEKTIKMENRVVTEGHIDGFAMFAGPNHVLYISPKDPDNKNKNEIELENEIRMGKNFQALRDARDKNGNNFKIEEVPCEVNLNKMFPADFPYIQELLDLDDDLVDEYLDQNKMVCVTRLGIYVNFIIVNDLVVMNSLYKEGIDDFVKKSDEECFKLLKKIFPNKKIEMIDTEAINWAGGSLHCICAHQMN